MIGLEYIARIGLRRCLHRVTLTEVLELRINKLLAEDRINSYYRVRSAKKAFERIPDGCSIHMDEIDVCWLEACERYWRKEGLSPTTIHIYMCVLKHEMNELVLAGKLRKGELPFGRGRYMMPCPEIRKLALDKQSIEAIRSFEGDATLERYRDLWMFSYLCNGINFRDMLFLRYQNIKDGEIVFQRSKTSKSLSHPIEIRAVYTEDMKKIVARWGNECKSPGTYLFKYATGNETPVEVDALVRKVTSLCNRSLKTLAGRLGITAFSTYSARHSFATVLNREGVSIKYISDSLGHASIAMTETYLAGASHEERKHYSSYLL